MKRRSFLKYTAAVAVGVSLPSASLFAAGEKTSAKLRKAVQLGMLPKELSDADKFKLAKKCGFQGVEAYPMDDLDAGPQACKI